MQNMNVNYFINNYIDAFGNNVDLPIAFYYDDAPLAKTEKVSGCLFKYFDRIRNGEVVSLNEENIACGGGKLYTGFAPMPDHVPAFVCETEKYKNTKESVVNYINNLNIEKQNGRWLNFLRIDMLDDFEKMEALMIFANPDMLAGLLSWACYDNHEDNAVSTPFGSGCSATISHAVKENKLKGNRCFLGLFDPSVRPSIKKDELCFLIPASRFKTMYHTMKDTCLCGTNDWNKVKARINDVK